MKERKVGAKTVSLSKKTLVQDRCTVRSIIKH